MNELVVLGLLSTVLSGTAGDTLNATILTYSPSITSLLVENASYTLAPNATTAITVPVKIKAGTHTKKLTVDTGTMLYALDVTTVGKRDLRWLWWACGTFVVIAIACAVRIRRTAADSS